MNDGNMFEGLKDLDADDEVESEAERIARDKFRTRRETIPERKIRGSDETIHTFSLRCRVTASNVFVRFCNERRLSYREGFDLVADMIAERVSDGKSMN